MKRAAVILVVAVLLVGSNLAWYFCTRNKVVLQPEWPNEEIRKSVAGRTVRVVDRVVISGIPTKQGPKDITVTDPRLIGMWLRGLSVAEWPSDPNDPKGQPMNQMISVQVFFTDGKSSGPWGFGTSSSRDCFSLECRGAFNEVSDLLKIPFVL